MRRSPIITSAATGLPLVDVLDELRDEMRRHVIVAEGFADDGHYHEAEAAYIRAERIAKQLGEPVTPLRRSLAAEVEVETLFLAVLRTEDAPEGGTYAEAYDHAGDR